MKNHAETRSESVNGFIEATFTSFRRAPRGFWWRLRKSLFYSD